MMINKTRIGCPFLFAVLTLPSLLFSIGCNAPKDQLKAFNAHFEAANYDGSAQFAQKKLLKRINAENTLALTEKEIRNILEV